MTIKKNPVKCQGLTFFYTFFDIFDIWKLILGLATIQDDTLVKGEIIYVN